MAKEAGLEFAGIQAGKYRRQPGAGWRNLLDVPNVAQNIADVGRNVVGVGQARRLLKKFKPDVVFCKGGYVTVPVGVAARLLDLPLVIHESDVTPGLSTRVLSRWAQSIAVGFPIDLYPGLPTKRLVFTGNPVRSEITDSSVTAAAAITHFFGQGSAGDSSLPVVLVIGGSSGAQTVNQIVESQLDNLLTHFRLIHVVGEKNLTSTSGPALLHPERYIRKSFLDVKELALAYKAATVVVSRAGAGAISELAVLGKPTVLIPNRLMAAHQVLNAEQLAGAGAVVTLDEQKLEADPTRLAGTLTKVAGSESQRRSLAQGISTFAQPDAASRLARLVYQAGGGR